MLEPYDSPISLLVDIGNTRTKYVFSDSQGAFSKVDYLYKEENLDSLLSLCSEVVIASVNNEEKLRVWRDACEKQNTTLHHIQTQAMAFGVACPYENPQKLGIDRWLCALAIAKRTHQAVAVIDVGTATTCDFIVNGEYLGGWIAPGFDLMRQSLVQNTAKVLANEHFPNDIVLGRDTEDCVNGGCLAMISGLITEAQRQLCQFEGENQVILTGGSASMLANVVSVDCIVEEDLLFKGLRLFSNSSPEN
ncbi:type III pantothenate kinase [Alteromonas sp. a30]|uniref:type III pantothenate kinase n=1 Tax=Alteromonas sp. a30 TaxID=2730917 RepID=UPI00227EF874|nr:type III pantothenate kinase [Alteromonas sp. a30]MCY7294774.1 type III pantothenate kinase [Alteromonas sp. a30]